MCFHNIVLTALHCLLTFIYFDCFLFLDPLPSEKSITNVNELIPLYYSDHRRQALTGHSSPTC